MRRYMTGQDKRAPAPLKACPWCGTPFKPASLLRACRTMTAPINLEIRCANTACDFTRERPLPILTVDEPIYRRLPAFLIATVDKFAGLPWVGETGAFFGHVDRFAEGIGFYGAAEPGDQGRPLDNGWSLDPPDLIIQDELHLISGPLGTVAGLYEAAIDQLASRTRRRQAHPAKDRGVHRHRPARQRPDRGAVRPPEHQHLSAARDRPQRQLLCANGAVVAGPGAALSRHSRAGARSEARVPARAHDAAGRRAGRIRRAMPRVRQPGENPADPYMTALCYFNALRELGGARRIVEDEVRDRAARYGTQRRRVDPKDSPFADRVDQGADGNHLARLDR